MAKEETLLLEIIPNQYKAAYRKYLKTKAENGREIYNHQEKISELEAGIDSARIKVKDGKRCDNCESDAKVIVDHGPVGPIYQCKVCGSDDLDI